MKTPMIACYTDRTSALPGDTILLALEYRFYMGLPDDATLVDYIVSRDTGYFEDLSLLQRARDVLSLPVGRLLNPLLVRRFGSFAAFFGGFFVRRGGAALRAAFAAAT